MIDAHHHLWRYTPADYGWIRADQTVLQRDFSIAELRGVAAPLGVTGTIAVQARQTLGETRALLALARTEPWIRGVVGWVPLTDPTLPALLDDLRGQGPLCAVRHVLQDEPEAEALMASTGFERGLRAVTAAGLAYDVLVFERHLPAVIALIDRHERARFVLDHLGKPAVSGPPPSDWRRHLRELARRPHVWCKISGLVTEVRGAIWTPDLLRSYLGEAAAAFGPSRLLWGSDWPVCLTAASYGQWLATVRDFAASWNAEDRDWLFHRTAATVYRLPS